MNDSSRLELVPDWQGMYFREKEAHEKTVMQGIEYDNRQREAFRKLASNFAAHIEHHHSQLAYYLMEQAEIESGIA